MTEGVSNLCRRLDERGWIKLPHHSFDSLTRVCEAQKR